MLAIKVEYLTGVCMATRHNDPSRSNPEWPPHPDRLYSALVSAAAHQTERAGVGPCITKEAERTLRWLANCGAPQLAVSQARRRTAPDIHMPSNPDPTEIPNSLEVGDQAKNPEKMKGEKEKGVRNLIPIYRKKASLPTPAVVPDEPIVYFIWRGADPDEHLEVLRRICRQVTYLGRSRTLVRVSMSDDPPPATLEQDPIGQIQLRVAGPGRIDYLMEKYKRDGGKPEPVQPQRYRNVVYKTDKPEVLHTIFDRMFIFKPKFGQPILPAEATLKITQTLREALIRCVHDEVCGCDRWRGQLPRPKEAVDCYRKIPPIISGHDPDSSVTQQPHVACIALPFVHARQRHADGTIKGLAVLVPINPSEKALHMLAAGLLRLLENGLGIPGVGNWNLKEVPIDDPPIQTLDITSWTKPSRVWTSATPMVFGHFPKEKNGGEPKVILDSLNLLGIDPAFVSEIAVGRHSLLHGAPPSWFFKTQRDRKPNHKPPRIYRHLTLRFDRAVRGPIVIGSMRFFGLGLMSPVEEA